MKCILLLIFTCTAAALAADNPPAADPKAKPSNVILEFEWTPVEKAGAYEVKLTPATGGAPLIFPTTKSSISQSVPPGKYQVQVRSQEKETSYFGPWSRPAEVEVVAKIVELVEPADGSTIPEPKKDHFIVHFKWNVVPGASQYVLRLWTDDPEKAAEYPLKSSERELELSPGQMYHWQVTLEDEHFVAYQANAKVFTFSILGKQLITPVVDPKIAPLDDPNAAGPHVTRLSWSKSEGAENYSAKIYGRALDESEYKFLMESKNQQSLTWIIPELKPGAYRIEVVASAKNRSSSKPGVLEFAAKPSAAAVAADQALAVK